MVHIGMYVYASGGATLCHRGLPTPTIFEKINEKLLYLSLWPQCSYAQDPGDPWSGFAPGICFILILKGGTKYCTYSYTRK